MNGKMKVAVMNGIGKMGFEERDIPQPRADEVLVKLEYVDTANFVNRENIIFARMLCFLRPLR